MIPEWLGVHENSLKNVSRELIREMIDEARAGFVYVGGEEKGN